MAIAFDNSGNGSNGWAGSSWTHICTGSNLFLAVGIATYSASLRTVTGITYNGVALTKANSITANLESNFQDSEMWYLDAPATGSNTVSVTYSGAPDFANGLSLSYTGKTTTGIDANNATQATSASTNSPACNVNVVHTDCWLIGYAYSRDSTVSAGTATTIRDQAGSSGQGAGDSNAVVSTGNQTLAFTAASATWPGVNSISISAANAGGGGTTVSGTVGTSTWGSPGASVATSTDMQAGVGTSTWSGQVASVATSTDLHASVGVSTWSGLTATVVLSSGATAINATVGISTWAGAAATIVAPGVTTSPYRVYNYGRARRIRG